MNINIKTNISNKFKEIMILIEAPKLSKEVQNVVDYVSELNSLPIQILIRQSKRTSIAES